MNDKVVEIKRICNFMVRNYKELEIHKDFDINLTRREMIELSQSIDALFDTSKIEVEEECPECYGEGMSPDTNSEGDFNPFYRCGSCDGTGKITRPAAWADIAKGGILRRKE